MQTLQWGVRPFYFVLDHTVGVRPYDPTADLAARISSMVGGSMLGGYVQKSKRSPRMTSRLTGWCVVSTNDGVGQIEILDDGLKLSLVVLGDLTAENGGDLAGLTDGAVGIQESLVQLIQCGAPMKEEVVAILHLGEKEPVLTTAAFAFAFFEEGSQTG